MALKVGWTGARGDPFPAGLADVFGYRGASLPSPARYLAQENGAAGLRGRGAGLWCGEAGGQAGMISHPHRTVFVHIPKCGGQSIETAFLADLGLGWKSRAPLLMGANDRPELGPPRLSHLRQAPVRTIVNSPHSGQASPS